MATRTPRRRRKRNRGWFKKGHDARRHTFTRQDCWLGYVVCSVKQPELREWLRIKVRCYYADRKREEALCPF